MKRSYKIPADIYERVHQTMLNIVNATLAEDDVLTTVYYEQLREFCKQQTGLGLGSGFLWEALADVTDDPAESRAYYEHALTLAQQNSEATDSILLELRQLLPTPSPVAAANGGERLPLSGLLSFPPSLSLDR